MEIDFKIPDTEERGVSPVIGVILMVAITVILAAVIGTFVLGLGDQVSQTAPQATISVEDTTIQSGSGPSSADFINVSHGGGDDIEGSETEIIVSQGSTVTFIDGSGTLSTAGTSSIKINSSRPTYAISGDLTYSTTEPASPSLDLSTGSDITLTFVDTGSGQIIAEKNIDA